MTQEVNQRRGANAKLTDAMRSEMKVLRREGWNSVPLAARFGVTKQTISAALNRAPR